jgi:hypothetical protein
MTDPVLPPSIQAMLDEELSEAAALHARSERRAKYWMSNLSVQKKVSALRAYINNINHGDIKFLRGTANSAATIDGLKRLSREAAELAFKLADREQAS